MKSLYFLFLIISISECANILGVFNYPSYSHQIVFQKIVKDLSERGHHLTILTVNRINENYPNVTEICMDGSYDKFTNDFNLAESKEMKYGALRLFSIMVQATMKRTIFQLNHPKIKNFLENSTNNKFDLMIVEYIYRDPMIFLSEIFDCPVVAVSSMEVTNFVHHVMGNYINFGIHPEYIFEYEHGKLTLFQRFVSVSLHTIISLLMIPITFIGESIVKQNLPNITGTISEVEERRIEFLLQNANPIFGATRPVTHNTIMLGNLHIEPPKEIQDFELKKVLDSTKNGIIYVSFGTNVNTNYLNNQTMSTFINTFKKLNYDFLWKLDGDHKNLFKSFSNIHVSKWYPQADLLAHRNVRLFITHCGLMSFEESIDREIPMVAIPFLFDQFKNSIVVKNEEIGVQLDYELMTEETLYNAILEALKPAYKKNIRNFKKLMYDFPIQSREKAVWWIEYAIRNKDRNRLKYIGAKIPFHQKYYLDIGLIILIMMYLLKKLIGYFHCIVVIKSKIKKN